MSLYNHNNVRVRRKRLPLSDKTNLMCEESKTSKNQHKSNLLLFKKGTSDQATALDTTFQVNLKFYRKGLVSLDLQEFQKIIHEQIILYDRKFQLIPKVHLNRLDSVRLKLDIVNDPKFKLIPRVHLHRLTVLELAIQIRNDLKFQLIPKVHLYRLDIAKLGVHNTEVMGHNSVLTRNGIITKNSVCDVLPNSKSGEFFNYLENTNSNSAGTQKSVKKAITATNSRPVKVNDVKNTGSAQFYTKNDTKTNFYPKLNQKLVVQVNRWKKSEESFKTNDKPQKIVKNVHFIDDSNSSMKFDKSLRRRRTKNYAEVSLTDSLNEGREAECNYKEHVPVYLRSTVTMQKQNRKAKDPFEYISDSPKKKKSGRPRKEILSPLHFQKIKKGRGRPKKEEIPSDSDSSVYDKSMHSILKLVKQKVEKKNKYNRRHKNNVQHNNPKIVGNQIINTQKQVTPLINKGRRLNFNGESSQNTNREVGQKKLQRQIVPLTSGVKYHNFDIEQMNKANELVINIEGMPGPSKTAGSKITVQKLRQEIQNISRRLSVARNRSVIAVESKANECDMYFGFEDDEDDDFSSVLPTTQGTSVSVRLSKIKPISVEKVPLRFTSLTSTPFPNENVKFRKPKNRRKVSKKINILSNILVVPSQKGTLAQTPQRVDFDGFENIRMSSSSAEISMVKSAEMSLKSDIPIFDNRPSLRSTVEKNKLKTTSVGLEKSPENDGVGFDNRSNSFVDKSTTPLGLTSKTSPITNKTKPLESGFLGFDNKQNDRNGMVSSRTSQRTSTPWRSDRLCVRRNPHFLALKDTSLPCYNQEMILEPKLLDRPKTPCHNETTQNNVVQSSILDFVNSSKANAESTPTKKNHNSTLFDENEFSPIKNPKSANWDVEEEKSRKITLRPLNGKKRNVFGVRRNISPLKPSNRQNILDLNEEFGVENYFGFDTHLEEKENVRSRRKNAARKNKNEAALPMRVPMKQVKRIREEAVEELLEKTNLEENAEKLQEVVESSLVNVHRQNDDNDNDDVPYVKLFEDLEDVKPSRRMYERKQTRRIRMASVDGSGESVEEEKPKRKRKDVRTAAEEEEFNEWAAAFNAMCNEVEQHNLETESFVV